MWFDYTDLDFEYSEEYFDTMYLDDEEPVNEGYTTNGMIDQFASRLFTPEISLLQTSTHRPPIPALARHLSQRPADSSMNNTTAHSLAHRLRANRQKPERLKVNFNRLTYE